MRTLKGFGYGRYLTNRLIGMNNRSFAIIEWIESKRNSALYGYEDWFLPSEDEVKQLKNCSRALEKVRENKKQYLLTCNAEKRTAQFLWIKTPYWVCESYDLNGFQIKLADEAKSVVEIPFRSF